MGHLLRVCVCVCVCVCTRAIQAHNALCKAVGNSAAQPVYVRTMYTAARQVSNPHTGPTSSTLC
jgi:hypothetical protein